MILAELALTPPYYLVLSALMFAVGATGLLIRRNPLVMFMCVELMLNGVNISFVAFGADLNDVGGQISVFFVLVVAAVEVVVGLALVVLHRQRQVVGRDRLEVGRGRRASPQHHPRLLQCTERRAWGHVSRPRSRRFDP